jgi:hypothetical protein
MVRRKCSAQMLPLQVNVAPIPSFAPQNTFATPRCAIHAFAPPRGAAEGIKTVIGGVRGKKSVRMMAELAGWLGEVGGGVDGIQ